jgi:hypothetical protein
MISDEVTAALKARKTGAKPALSRNGNPLLRKARYSARMDAYRTFAERRWHDEGLPEWVSPSPAAVMGKGFLFVRPFFSRSGDVALW